MTRKIIDYEDKFPLLVSTYWMGSGEGVQVTEANGKEGYVQMTREEAINFFETALKRLKEQIEKDKTDPPWWQKKERNMVKLVFNKTEIEQEELPGGRHLIFYSVKNNKNETLGYITNEHWNRWTWEQDIGVIMSRDCLKQIYDFMQELGGKP